jgi:preprotein translocase subunit SecF
MTIIKYRKIFYLISGFLLLGSLLSISIWGLKPGIDFAGGSLLSVSFEGKVPESEWVINRLGDLNLGEVSVRSAEDGFIVRTREISQSDKDRILTALAATQEYRPIEKNFSSIGPVLGKEAVYKSWVSIALVLLAIVLFIAFAFRKISALTNGLNRNNKLSSWVYGLVTIFALLHDVLIPTGVFAVLGHFARFEVDTLFVTALLVILGFSVHDTIVVFDRVRENLLKNEEYKEGKDFETVVGESVSQTLVRSINTSLTTLLSIIALYFFGPHSVQNFSLTLMIGIAVGTYSSIFIGSPLLVTINNWKRG